MVSLVPSWTETLIECGVNVVGRTRFCIHPADRVRSLPAVGGTKDLDRAALEQLKPDVVIFDRDENIPAMAQPGPWKNYVTHIQRMEGVPVALREMAHLFGNEKLAALAGEWEALLREPAFKLDSIYDFPGRIEWIRKPENEPENLLYIIWRGPWMAVSRETFIGSMISRFGFTIPEFPEKYPKIDLAFYDPQKTLLLFSTEPYPFAQKKRELLALDFPSALVDGEAYSWFGLRSLRFLQKLRN